MRTNQVLYRNPEIIEIPLSRDFFYVKNPAVPNGEQLLNRIQHHVFSSIPVGGTNPSLIKGLKLSELSSVLDILKIKKLISEKKNFQPPVPTKTGELLTLWLHTSNSCNLACAYCYVNAEKRGRKMNEAVWKAFETKIKRIIDKSPNLRTLTLKLAGGEPLLTFKEWKIYIERIIAYAREYPIKINIQILTNGTIITPAILNFIEKYNVGVGLSIDGYESAHDETRHFHNGNGSFSKVIETLNILRRHGVMPYITTVVGAKNANNLIELSEFLISEDLPFRFSLEKGSLVDNTTITNALMLTYRYVDEHIDTYSLFLDHTVSELSFYKPVVDTPCGVGKSHGSINIDGSLHTCQTQHKAPALGNVSDEDNIFSMLERARANKEHFGKHETCQNCSYKYICSGGCPTDKRNHKSPYCQTFLDIIPTILKLRGKTILNNLSGRYSLNET